jgi:hypothetical protein
VRRRDGRIEGKGSGHWTVSQIGVWGVGIETKRRPDRREGKWTLDIETERNLGVGSEMKKTLANRKGEWTLNSETEGKMGSGQ